MKNKLLLPFLLLFFWISLDAQVPFEHKKGEIIIQLKADKNLTNLTQDTYRQSFTYQVKNHISTELGIYLIAMNDPQEDQEEAFLQMMQTHPAVEFAQFNRRVYSRNTEPDDARYAEQWHMDIINAPAVWDFTTGGLSPNDEEIVVAMLDGGFDDTHEDLLENLWRNKGEIPNDNIDNDNNGFIDDINGWNVKSGSNDHTAGVPINSISHGTSTAGIVGAKGDNGIGVTGVNWNVKLMLLSGTEFEDEIISAYLYARDQRRKYNQSNGQQGAYVVATNFSLGIDNAMAEDSPIWCNVYNQLGQEGILSVGATTNRNVNVDIVGDMPTTCSSNFLIAVTNTDELDEKAERAGVGARSIDLGAPGQISFTTRPNNDYGKFPGTSASAPHVAGAIALLYSLPSDSLAVLARDNPQNAASLVKQFILQGVKPINDLDGVTVSEGRLDLLITLELMRNYFGVSSGELEALNVFPNPARNMVRIEFESPNFDDYTLRVYDALGREVITRDIKPQQFSTKFQDIDVEGWAQGVYFITLTQGKEILGTQFVKY